MSLINEALKQAEADKRRSLAGGGLPEMPGMMEPSLAVPEARTGGKGVKLMLVGLLLLAAAGLAGWQWMVRANPLRPLTAAANTLPLVAPMATSTPAAQSQPSRPQTQPLAKAVQSDGSSNGEAARMQDVRQSVKASEPPRDLQRAPANGLPAPEKAAGPAQESRGSSSPAGRATVQKTSTHTESAGEEPKAAASQPSLASEEAVDGAATLNANATAADFKVSGILMGSDGGTAIINGQFMRVGQVIDGAKVMRICPQSVELDLAGKRVTLSM